MADAFDLFVIGGGSAGVRAARMAALRGARVALAEAAALGGTCVHRGCIPKKLYSYAAHLAADFRHAAGFGWRVGEAQFDWAVLKAHRAAELRRLDGVYRKLLLDAGVHIVPGWGLLRNAHTVQVRTAGHDECFTATHILVATGARPSVPAFPGSEHVLTSDSMFDLEPFPKRLLVVGGGYIACEFASIFHGLGARVTQLHRGEQVLRGFDDDVRRHLAQEMRRHGVDLRMQSAVESIHRKDSGLLATLRDGERVEVDTILCATGRVPNVAGLGLQAVGVEQASAGGVKVDEHYCTSVPSIFAAGDVIARVQLTPVALAEAMMIVDQLFGPGVRRFGYELIPTAVFTHPNVGCVGLTETAARQQFGNVKVFRSEFRALRHSLSGSGERTLMKLVVDAGTDRVVGLHMVGAEAGEIVQGFGVALRAGATKAVFDETVGVHPTIAEEFVTMRQEVVG